MIHTCLGSPAASFPAQECRPGEPAGGLASTADGANARCSLLSCQGLRHHSESPALGLDRCPRPEDPFMGSDSDDKTSSPRRCLEFHPQTVALLGARGPFMELGPRLKLQPCGTSTPCNAAQKENRISPETHNPSVSQSREAEGKKPDRENADTA